MILSSLAPCIMEHCITEELQPYVGESFLQGAHDAFGPQSPVGRTTMS